MRQHGQETGFAMGQQPVDHEARINLTVSCQVTGNAPGAAKAVQAKQVFQ